MEISNTLPLIPQIATILQEQNCLDQGTLDRLLMLSFKSNNTLSLVDSFLDFDAKILMSSFTSVLDRSQVTPEQATAFATAVVSRLPSFATFTSKSGRLTFLMAACRFKSPIAANILLDSGANVNAIDKKGRTVLHHLALGIVYKIHDYVSEKDRIQDQTVIAELIWKLLHRGTDKYAVDRGGKTAKQILMSHKKTSEYADLL